MPAAGYRWQEFREGLKYFIRNHAKVLNGSSVIFVHERYPVYMSPPGLDIGTALLISGLGLAFSILASAVSISYFLGKMNSSLEGLDEVDRLTTQIDTFARTFDAAAAGRVPRNVERMRTDIDHIAESIEPLDEVDDSVSNIEAAITAVDLPGIQDAIEQLFTDTFGDDTIPIGNSVQYTLDESGLEVAISLAGIGDDATRVTIRFDRAVQIESISDRLSRDAELAQLEEELFGTSPQIVTPSPRQLNYRVHSSDLDTIAEWVPAMVETLDKHVVKTTASEREFDEKVGEALGQNESA